MENARPLLEALERSLSRGELEEPLPSLAFVAAQGVRVPAEELHGARRRALLLLATRGDPRRGLVPDSRAVTSLADELASDERKAELVRGLAELRTAADRLPTVEALLELLARDRELAWRAYACALLADALAEE